MVTLIDAPRTEKLQSGSPKNPPSLMHLVLTNYIQGLQKIPYRSSGETDKLELSQDW